ncbi:MAG: carboxypeptidase-like regulatory domain-containing protein [Paludibacteraceae bacterium]|nr:carboxypeptidase-like regulatory domain-containing protein [Paludibacteraceae bacterium]
MKKLFLTLLAVASVGLMAHATDLTGKRIYVNPGHGSWGPNDRPMATIPFPNLPTTQMPDTLGFYESNTNMWKCLELTKKLRAAGAYVMMSHTQCGPWPYTMVNGDYPAYTWAEYQNLPDIETYNRNLSEICTEVEANNMDYFISVHSNAATDGSTTNYPLLLYRGKEDGSIICGDSKQRAITMWPYIYELAASGLDPATAYSLTSHNARADMDFTGWDVTSYANGIPYRGAYGVLRHGTPGFLSEGYFHTYQPARHRALNKDYCRQEGTRYYRGICAYYNADPETFGYIMGTVKDMDQKFQHQYFKPSPRTNDQWLPCNGATVYLLSEAGDTLKSYQVDNYYNGIFVFDSITPGTYHLAASCPGYFDLDATQMAENVTVTANTTTYPMLYLRNSSWEPDPIVFETYPDKSKDVTGLDGQYNFGAAQTASFASLVAGKEVRQVLVRDDKEAYVLAIDTEAHTSFLYKINPLTGALIQEVSTEGTQGEIYPLYSIDFTADSVLVGCNYTECQFSASEVGNGLQTRGTFRTYYWNMADLSAAPTQWFSSQYSAVYYNAWVGRSFAVSGKLDKANVYTDFMTIYGSTNIRLAMFTTEDKQLVSVVRNQSDANEINENLFGAYTALATPNSDEEVMLLGATKSMEYGFTTDGQFPDVHFNLPAAKGAGAFKYGGKSVLAAVQYANGAVTGVNLYNFTEGMAEATVTTTNISLNQPTTYYSVKPLADGKNIILYVATDDAIYRYTTVGQAQPKFTNIYAYGLDLTQNAEGATFTFTLNTDPISADLIIYNENAREIKRVAVANAQKGLNTLTLAPAELPRDSDLTWAIEATAPTVGNWSVIAQKTPAECAGTRIFNAVNIYPQTENFGTIYLMDRAGANDQRSGLHIMTPDFVLENETAYKGGQSYYGSPYRFGIASDGALFIGDWADPHSGVYVAEEADVRTLHTAFFAGSQNSSGLWKSNGVEEGSSTSSVYVYGTGADTKLLVYNEDPGATLPENGLCVYNIGQENDSILHFWDGAPSQKITFAGQANTNGNVWGCSQGVWVSQHRSAGNNNSSATSLRFYTWEGECTYTSHLAPVDEYEALIIEGSLGSCFALSPDEKTLILNGCDNEFLVFNVNWNGSTPTLNLAYRYKHSEISDNGVGDGNGYGLLQMNWDYAQNLIITGQSGLIAYALPKDINKSLTPAKASLLLNKRGAENPESGLEDVFTDSPAEKFYIDGKVYIRKGEAIYTTTGLRVK